MVNFSYYIEMSRRLRPFKAAPKILNYLRYRFLRRKCLMFVSRYTPQIATLFLTIRCNLNCEYCNTAKMFHEDNSSWREREASLEKVQRIFDNPLFSNCLFVDLLGGEPLLVEDLDRIVAYLAKRGHITNIATNGLLLAQRIADLKCAGISRISVSLYDVNREVMERDLVKINQVFAVHASFVLLRNNVEKHPEEILMMANFVRDAGCLSLRFFMYHLMGIDPRPQEIITDTLPAYLELRRKIEDRLPGFCVWPVAVKREVTRKLCPHLWQRVGCDALGNMAICCGTDTTLQGPNSNLFDGDPDVVFNHPTLVAIRKQLMDPKSDPPEICRNCNLLLDPGW